MYQARIWPLPCVGCGRSLAAAAARCPYCSIHVRHSHAAYARPRAAVAYPGSGANHTLKGGESNE
jgi:hypothetical protein